MPAELLVGFDSSTENGSLPVQRPGEPAVMRLMEIIRAIRVWAPTVEDRMQRAYLVSHPEGLRLVAIPRRPEDHSSLLDSMVNLSLTLCDAGFDLSVRVYPDGTNEQLQAYFDPGSAILFSWR